MHNARRIVPLAVIAALCLEFAAPRARADFHSCKSDLEDAEHAAGEADDAQDEYDSCDHEEPGDCRAKRDELNSAKDDLVRKLRDAMDTCKSAMQ